MPLHADIVGQPLPEQIRLVTPRMALAFAAGIHDDNAVCIDDLTAGFMAPPYFCVSLEWQIAVIARTQDMGLTQEETLRGVHVGQDSQFLSPIHPGVTARITGKVIEVRSARAGALARTKFEIFDADTGEALSSTISSSLYRNVAVEGADCAADEVDRPPEWVGAAKWEAVTLQLDRGFAQRYTECADIWNPIHTERKAALSAGLQAPIVHGTALWALAGRELVSRYVPGSPQSLLSLSARFSAMVRPATQIVLRHGELEKKGEIAFTVETESGAHALTCGKAEIARRMIKRDT
ncbi:MAG: MaoC/PaaZ C-terminal domain-containing protein [Rhizomicrobium sp.]